MFIWNATGYYFDYVNWEGTSFPVYETEPIKLRFKLNFDTEHPMCSARLVWELTLPYEFREGDQLRAGHTILISKEVAPLVKELRKKLFLQAGGAVDILVVNPDKIKKDEVGKKYIDNEGLYQL